MQGNMEFADSGAALTACRHIEVARGVHTNGTIGACLSKGNDVARQSARVLGIEAAIHPFQGSASAVIVAVANIRRNRCAAWVVTCPVEIGGKCVRSAIGRYIRHFGWIIEIGKLRL